MQIIINGSFWAQPNVGSGQYLHGLLDWLPRVAPQHHYTLVLPASSPAGPPVPPGIRTLRVATPFDRLNENLAKLCFEQLALPRAARHLVGTQRRNAVLFIPYFAPPVQPLLPLVTTVGDLAPLVLPAYRGGPHVRAYMALVRRSVQRSAEVLTFSAASRAELISYLHLPARRITPVLLAAGAQYCLGDQAAARAEVARRYDISEPFIYYVGGLDARKNLATLVRAFALLHPHDRRVRLVIAGRALGRDRRLFPDLDALISELDLIGAVRRIDVPHEDGPLLYRACTIFAFPSRYEGFGLPPLEAMACGTPVVVSDTSSLPEVVGPAALRVPPDDIVGWAAALRRLLGDPALRTELTNQGYAHAARFSYRRVAEETLAVLTRAAG